MPKAKCPTCATVVTYAAGYDPICPACGFRGEAPAALQSNPSLLSPRAQAAAFASSPSRGVPAPTPLPPQPLTYGNQAPPKEQGMAIGALVCGLVGFVIPGVCVVAVILGAIAMSNADRNPQTQGGKGMAIAGLVLGIIVSVFWLFVLGAAGDAFGSW